MASPKGPAPVILLGTGHSWLETNTSEAREATKRSTWSCGSGENSQVVGKVRQLNQLERCGKGALRRCLRCIRLPPIIYFLDVGID